jgi:hypothetical protein
MSRCLVLVSGTATWHLWHLGTGCLAPQRGVSVLGVWHWCLAPQRGVSVLGVWHCNVASVALGVWHRNVASVALGVWHRNVVSRYRVSGTATWRLGTGVWHRNVASRHWVSGTATWCLGTGCLAPQRGICGTGCLAPQRGICGTGVWHRNVASRYWVSGTAAAGWQPRRGGSGRPSSGLERGGDFPLLNPLKCATDVNDEPADTFEMRVAGLVNSFDKTC